jgi:hypothetical protein
MQVEINPDKPRSKSFNLKLVKTDGSGMWHWSEQFLVLLLRTLAVLLLLCLSI